VNNKLPEGKQKTQRLLAVYFSNGQPKQSHLPWCWLLNLQNALNPMTGSAVQ
jgi:hypothetical protein